MIEKNEKVGIDIMAIIKKSRPLFPLWSSNLSPYALKIFEVYLSKIDMDNPETKCVVFPKRLLEKIFGVKRIRKGKLEPALDQLMNSTVRVEDKINGKRVDVWLNLMEAASLIATDDPENTSGVQQIKMICSEKAMEYIFNVPKKGFIPYDLEYVISAKRKCDYMLFLYLTFNRFRTKFEVKVEDLKKVLRCDKEETYDDFRYFNDLVLKKSQKALRENCNYRFKYKAIKTGRRVTSILFDLSEAPEKFTHKNKYPSTTTTEQKQAEKTKMVNKVKQTLPPPSNPEPSCQEADKTKEATKTKNEKSGETKKWNRKGRPIAEFENKKWDFDIGRLILNRREDENFDDCDEFKEKLRV